MSRRALHLVSLLLLLTVIGATESVTLRDGVAPFAAPYIAALLHARQNVRSAHTAFAASPGRSAVLHGLTAHAVYRAAEDVCPPLAAACLTHAVTGSSL
jgi:hypothetical protein